MLIRSACEGLSGPVVDYASYPTLRLSGMRCLHAATCGSICRTLSRAARIRIPLDVTICLGSVAMHRVVWDQVIEELEHSASQTNISRQPATVSAFAAAASGPLPGEDDSMSEEACVAALAAEVLHVGCLLATDPVAGVAALGTALLSQVDVEVAVASLPPSRGSGRPLAPTTPRPVPLRILPSVGESFMLALSVLTSLVDIHKRSSCFRQSLPPGGKHMMWIRLRWQRLHAKLCLTPRNLILRLVRVGLDRTAQPSGLLCDFCDGMAQ